MNEKVYIIGVALYLALSFPFEASGEKKPALMKMLEGA